MRITPLNLQDSYKIRKLSGHCTGDHEHWYLVFLHTSRQRACKRDHWDYESIMSLLRQEQGVRAKLHAAHFSLERHEEINVQHIR